jgi:hypothetical protein
VGIVQIVCSLKLKKGSRIAGIVGAMLVTLQLLFTLGLIALGLISGLLHGVHNLARSSSTC